MIYRKAKFIYLDESSVEKKGRYGGPSPYFRKTFRLNGRVRKATLSVSAIGVFKAYINGQEADGDYLSPGFTDYRRRIPYIEYDISDKLQQDNAVGIVAGDGWAVGYLSEHGNRQNFSDRVEILAVIRIEYDDGRQEWIETDGSWKGAFGAIVYSDIYMGEFADARRDLGDFSRYWYDDGGWRQATEVTGFHLKKQELLDREIAPRTKVKHRIEPTFLFTDGDGRRVYDFQQNITGVVSLTLRGERNTKITVRHGELLNADGTLYRENLRTAEATDVYILAGAEKEIFRPLFTFHGFRYADVLIEGDAEILAVQGLVMYSDLAATADFSCSSDTVNRLYRNIVWGQRGNFLNIPSDCPQRDERFGWTGDTQVFCGTAMFNMDCRRFYKKHLADIRDAQLGNGAIPGIAPVIPYQNTAIQGWPGSAGWSDVITVLPYEYFRMYGDETVIKENICAAKRYMRFCLDNSDGYIRQAHGHYGDWLSIGETTDKVLIATAFFAYSCRLTEKMCRIIGDGDADTYAELYEQIKQAFRRRFFEGGRRLQSDTQTAYLLGYVAGVLEQEETRDNLLRCIHRNEDKLTTGFLGVKYLLPVLCDLGESDLAYKLLTNTVSPSWCYAVLNGATTIWERWDGYSREKGVTALSEISFNHYAYGSVGEWFFKYCLGIVPDDSKSGAGFRGMTVRPFPDTSGRIVSASGCYDSVNGRITASWKRTETGFYYKVELPDTIRVTYDFSHFDVKRTADGGFELLLAKPDATKQ